MQGDALSVYQPLGALDIAGRRRMLKRFQSEVIIFVPLTGTDMQFIQAIFRRRFPSRGDDALVQTLSQQIGKEMMITVPATLVVQRDEEQVGAFEIFKGFLPGRRWVEQNRITKGTAQA